MLVKEILIIEQELFEQNKILEVLKPIYEELEERNNEYETPTGYPRHLPCDRSCNCRLHKQQC